MSDLISRSALLAEYDRVHVGEPGGARTLIEAAPAVYAEPVRHGEWENYPSHSYRRCSICKMEWEKPRFNTRSNYCPNCGAKMKETKSAQTD